MCGEYAQHGDQVVEPVQEDDGALAQAQENLGGAG